MRVILCGYNWVGCKALELLLKGGHQVYVYTHENPYYINDLEGFCQRKGIEYSLSRIRFDNLPFTPDIIISTYYRYIIPEEVINSCGGKIFNLHPSLLPSYKGCSSVTWAMIKGERYTGFTFHYIDTGIDTGNILLQKPVEIEEFDTQETLYLRVMFEAMKYFNDVLDKVKDGYPGEVQKAGDAKDYYKRGCPHDGIINKEWDEHYKERFVRAMIYAPLPPAVFNGEQIFSMKNAGAAKNGLK